MKTMLDRFRWCLTAGSLALVFACPAADTTVFRAARSVHLGYSAPEGLVFYNEMVVEKTVAGSYFMACGWDTGYFGIQQLGNPAQKVAIFSVWDPTVGDDPNAVKSADRVEVLYEGEGVRIKRFGGEGTGGQCMWDYPWKSGETNRFLISARVEGQKTAYTAWICTSNLWKQLATFRVQTHAKPLSGYYAFLEDFRRDGKSVHEERRARFGNGWVKTTAGKWEMLGQARFTASNAEWESKENINAGVNDGVFFLATGGEVKRSRDLRSLMELPAPRPGSPKFAVPLPTQAEKP
jgi:hypothetical protein